ncbi:hypothetical protein AK812_SmicGene34256 [Symbiodinium microadriaticum]|uniref:Uncharacterized protein n=1 Tax=Symbiodinium microadriaticum TaxID=2951 RepID=A0A1Q9CPH3_SYMMI|nr:hypothetical protein AK812_SmicGene34256 [Symbiodinium microadriaticum]
MDSHEAAQRALEAAERRRKLAANIAPETPGPGADAGGGKRTRPMKDITVNETPTCKTPNPKHIKNTECATTPAVDPKQQTPVVNTPNQQTPVVNTPNKKLFATPARELHNDLMASTLADTLVDDGAEADIELQQKIDADLANLSLEDDAKTPQSSNLGSGPTAVQVEGSAVTDNAASALMAKELEVQQAVAQQGSTQQAPQGSTEKAPQGSSEKAPPCSSEKAPQSSSGGAPTPQPSVAPASQAMDNYLDSVYAKSHRCDSKSPPGMRNAAPQEMEVEPKAPQAPQPPKPITGTSNQGTPVPMEVEPKAPQEPQTPKPITPTSNQGVEPKAPQEPQPITGTSNQGAMEVEPTAPQKPQLPEPIAGAPNIAQASTAAQQQQQQQEMQQMPPPSQVPVKMQTESIPALPPSSAPSTPGPSDVDDDPELSALADVAHQLKEAARKTRMRFLRSFESTPRQCKKCPAVVLEQWNKATNSGGPRDPGAVDRLFREYIMAGESWGCSRVVAVHKIISSYSAEGVYVWINRQD